MQRLTLLVFATLALFPSLSRAELHGSQTALTITGTYFLDGSLVTTTLPSGDTRDTATHIVKTINNTTLLEVMRVRSLISQTAGYKLVMVGNAHMADGIKFFAISGTTSTVEVPGDLLALSVQNGPVNGVMVIGSTAVLKTLSQQSNNLASLTLPGFTGSGALKQNWSAKVMVKNSVSEGVELVSGTGTFSGPVTYQDKSGVGLVTLTLNESKAVDLTRYGMVTSATPDTSGGGSTGGVLVIGSGSGTLGGSNTYTGSTTISSGTLNLGSGTLTLNSSGTLSFTNLGSYNFANLSTLTINTTQGGTLTGLVVDANGNVTQFPTFGNTVPGTLVIITSSGTHTYTQVSGVWTPVTP
jgi:autotransporter-associated beta strand protein